MSAFSFGALCFSSLFTVIDPIAAAPVFATITRGASRAAVRRIAVRACLVALAVLLVFATGGAFVFRLFGITIDAFRIGGGLVFLLIGLPMLSGGSSHGGVDAAPADAAKDDPSVVPLGVPLIGGPGAITTVMLLMGQAQGAVNTAAVIAALVLSIAATCAVLVVSPVLTSRLGHAGLELVTRVMGLIVVVIGVQFVIDGARPIAIDILRSAHGA